MATMLKVFRYWKPRGVVSSLVPSKDGLSIIEHSGALAHRLSEASPQQAYVPVGRLDKDSHGLLLLTNQPRLAEVLLRPSRTPNGSPIDKEYHVITSRRVSDSQLRQLRGGVGIRVPNWGRAKPVVTTLPCIVERLSNTFPISQEQMPIPAEGRNSLRFVLREGKNRQVRKMVGAVGHKVEQLLRVRFGPVSLAPLTEEGQAELLAPHELQQLLEAARLCEEELTTLQEGEDHTPDFPVRL